MGRIAMAQHVWGNISRDASAQGRLLDHVWMLRPLQSVPSPWPSDTHSPLGWLSQSRFRTVRKANLQAAPPWNCFISGKPVLFPRLPARAPPCPSPCKDQPAPCPSRARQCANPYFTRYLQDDRLEIDDEKACRSTKRLGDLLPDKGKAQDNKNRFAASGMGFTGGYAYSTTSTLPSRNRTLFPSTSGASGWTALGFFNSRRRVAPCDRRPPVRLTTALAAL